MSHLAFESAVVRALRCATQTLALAVVIALPGIASANPSGASIAHGSATFATPDAATLNITTSNGAIINWQQFGINPGEVTRFLQQGGSAAVLNRVVGGDPSAILGSLLSNGRVFLINPNGVVFGPNSVVDTAGLVVSTLNMTDDDFINGRLHFQGDGSEGAIVNQGAIRAEGSVILIAPRIENSGLIETAGGGLLLAAGREVTITSFENPEIAYLLQAPENEVVNLGQMITNGGAASVFAGSIRHSGDIDANSVVVDENGRVQLIAKRDVHIEAGSTISANGASGGEIVVQSVEGTVMVEDATLSATGDAGRGGDIRVLGEQVGLTGTTAVDASGRDGGGQVLIGGDYLGENPQVSNARFTFMGEGTRIDASAGTAGDGGKVILWADDSTRAHGTISATGGANRGDGGFVEISGKRGLVFQADVDTTATAGAAGTLLLDPDSITIIDGMGGTNDGSLPVFTAVGVTTIGELALEGQATNVVLVAADDIVLNDLTDNQLTMFGLVGGESFTLRTTGAGNIVFNDFSDEIFTAGADIILEANGTGDLLLGNVTTDGGSLTGGDITLTALSGNVILNGLVQSGDPTASVGFITGDTITSVGAGSISVGKLSLQSQNGINLSNGNAVEQLTADNAVSGNIVFNNLGPVLTLAADGIISVNTAVENHAVGGQVQITTSADLNIDDLLTSAGNVSLDAGADIDQLFAGAITASVLNVDNASTVAFGTANNLVSGLSASNIGGGGIDLTNNSGVVALALNNIDATGNITIVNSGGVSVVGTVEALSATLSITENSGDINDAGSGLLRGDFIQLAAGGIGNGSTVHTDLTFAGLGALQVTTSGTAASGNIDIEELNAISTSSVNITTDSISTQSVKFVTASGNLTINSAFGDSGDDYNIWAETASLLGISGSVDANNLTLRGTNAMTLSGTVFNSVGSTSGNFGFGGFSTSGASQLVSGSSISLSGNSNVTLSPGGAIDLDAPVGNVTINLLSGGQVTNGGATGGVGVRDIRADSINLSTTGVNVDVDVATVNNVSTGAGNTVLVNTGPGVLTVTNVFNGSAGGSVLIKNEQNGIVLGDVNLIGAGGTFDLLAGTLSGSGAITDGNGGALNVLADNVSFTAATGIGTLADPIETQLTTLVSAGSTAGTVAIANTGTLALTSNFTVTGGDLLLSGTTGLSSVSRTLLSGGDIILSGGSGTLLIDLSTVTANAALTVSAADIDVYSSIVNGNTIAFSSTGTTHIDAGTGTPALINASNSATFAAGTTFLLEGGSSPGDDAKINATNTVTINATDVIVKGGSASGAFASIDPATITINASRDILVQAGPVASAYADIVADNLVTLNAGRNIDVIGDGDFAVIESNFGDVVISALGAVTLTAGSSGLGDAVIAANGGSGTVDISSASCVNCVLLGFDPFANAAADAGAYAATLNVISPSAAPAGGGSAAQGDSVDISENAVLVLRDLSEELVAGGRTDDEDEDDQKICR